MALIDELVQKITIKADAKALDVVQKKEEKLIQTTNTLGKSFKSAFLWILGGFTAKSIVDANITMDSLTRSFEALAEGSEAGAEQIKYLRKEANRLGQDFVSISNAYKNFFAVGKGAGMQTSETQNIFTSILEASTVLGSSAQSTEGALLAVEQMISKGKVSMEELRRQLGNALPGAFQISAKAMGVTTAELEKLISKGLDSQDFVKKFSKELKKNYSGDKLTGPVKSLRAEFARLNNALFDLKTGVLSGDTGKAFAELVRSFTEFLTSKGFLTFLKGVALLTNMILKNIRLIIEYYLLYKGVKVLKQLKLFGVFMKAFNAELAISNSLSKAMSLGFLKSLKVFMRLTKGSLLFAKNIALALSILLLSEDLIASLIPGSKTTTKRTGKALGDKLTEATADWDFEKIYDKMLSYTPTGRITKLFMPKHTNNAFEKDYNEDTSNKNSFMFGAQSKNTGDSDVLELALPQMTPQININQNILNGENPDAIGEKTGQAVENALTLFLKGGVR